MSMTCVIYFEEVCPGGSILYVAFDPQTVIFPDILRLVAVDKKNNIKVNRVYRSERSKRYSDS